MRSYHSSNLSSGGFTLLEVLLGMSLLSVMMLLLYGSLSTCVRNWDAGEKKIAEVNQLAVVQKFFKNRLESIFPLEDNFSSEEKSFSFQGQEERLQFVSAMPASAGRLGLQLFTLELERGTLEKGGKISVSITPFFPLLEGKEWDDEKVVIVEKVKNMELSYFGAEERREEPAWRNEWLEMKKLPLLVSVAIELINGDIWPEIVISPRIDGKSVTENIFGIEDGRFTTDR
jgi:general secretion pathway protein J